MKQCWPEGDLRAYLDGELPAETLKQVADHLQVCGECATRHRELSGRAARVSNLMAMLPAVSAPAPAMRIAPLPRNRPARWTIAATALAAGLLIGYLMIPKRVSPPPRIATPAAVAAAESLPTVTEPQPVATRPPVRRRTLRPAIARPSIVHADFMRLDDEPFETGTVVRVSAENGDVQADLIVGPDGRAHAIRVVNSR